MQIVYLSNRPEILQVTLERVRLFLPFVDEVLIVAPESTHKSIKYPPSLNIVVLSDEELIDGRDKKNLDHQSLNYALRSALADHSAVNEEFIMSDDDARPIRPVTLNLFKHKGKYNNYYFYDLAEWRSRSCAFDLGQQTTYQILNYFGYSHLSYASHMPQIINKSILKETAKTFEKQANRCPLCEWSTYFNYGHRHHPALFHPPRPFQTLCWPEFPGAWPYYVRPERYSFENYYPGLYAPRALFSGLAPAPDPAEADTVNIEKIHRWHQAQIGALHLDVFKTDNPWTKNVIRRLGLFIIRPFHRLFRVLSLEPRMDRMLLNARVRQSLEDRGHSFSSEGGSNEDADG